MKRTVSITLMALLLLTLNLGWRMPQDKKDITAYVVKIVRDVKKKGPTTGWQSAVALDMLRSGYQIRTEDNSLAMIKFADETKLIVRQKSLVDIKGQVSGKQILDRTVYTERGSIQFNVVKQQKEQFRFSSPVSVASIRGTEGAFNVGSDSTDKLIINRGLATLTNLISNRSQDVNGGETGESDGSGNIRKRKSTQGEQEEGSGNLNSRFNQGLGDEKSPDQKSKRTMRIPGVDKDGNSKALILEWED
jgi:hypothetical protein